jgi:hypothetical protein
LSGEALRPRSGGRDGKRSPAVAAPLQREVGPRAGKHARVQHSPHTLAFELFPERVHELPVGSIGEKLLRSGFDHSGFAQPQRIEP